MRSSSSRSWRASRPSASPASGAPRRPAGALRPPLLRRLRLDTRALHARGDGGAGLHRPGDPRPARPHRRRPDGRRTINGASARVRLAVWRVETVEVDPFRGAAANPLSDDELSAVFRGAAAVVHPRRTGRRGARGALVARRRARRRRAFVLPLPTRPPTRKKERGGAK